MPKLKKGVVKRTLKMVFQFYPVRVSIIIFCILFNAAVSSIPSVFMQQIIGIIEDSWQSGDWAAVSGEIFSTVAVLAVLYILSLISAVVYNQMGATVTQGVLMKMRVKLFGKMQTLPIKYFDTHNHGDIMSVYT
ncbi:MAG: ABC transporter ATP-binding protein, partial [Ruminiclostridium sp.]|nr:ABC transporter ATP-binding protein [Ruminiclostridium sp.]